MKLFSIELSGGNKDWIIAKDLTDAALTATRLFGSRVTGVEARSGVVISDAVRAQIVRDAS